ncbi:MAG: hypothetical protein QOF21_1577 [Actinomycetota bacterium]|jgi:ribosomal protein S18 acetylase RimI-like enzyme
MLLRPATSSDIAAIAALHVDSWRRNYRGALSDAFLDGPIEEDRLSLWTGRLAVPHDGASTTVAVGEDGALVGLVHTIFDVDERDGALLENLHVVHALKRSGIGTQLMAAAAGASLAHAPNLGMYLTVLEQNTSAQAFYEARGGTRVGAEPWYAPDGGTTTVFRYAWADPSLLL